jgi:hypothetical protein
MPIIRDIELTLTVAQTLRRQCLGKQNAKFQPGMQAKLQGLLDNVHKDHLLEPAIIYELHPILNIISGRIYLSGGVSIRSSFIASHFPSAKELAVLVCTIGPGLEARVAEFFQQDAPLLGLFLDGIGNAALDLLSEKTCQIINKESLLRGYQSSSPLSPGMPGLSILEQKKLLKLIPANEIGVKLTAGGTMVPRKSLSMIICIGYDMAQWTKDELCGRCPLRKTCQYKVQAAS